MTPAHDLHARDADRVRDSGPAGHAGHGGWAMLLCCIPMVLIILLVVFGR